MKQMIATAAMLYSMQLTAQHVGIGTSTPQQKLDVAGKVTIRDSLGIGTSQPNAQLQFGNTSTNRKIVLYDGAGGDNHRFYGFGINGNVLRYQTDAEISDHIFYAGLSNAASRELMRIKGNGSIGIGISNPIGQLSNTATNFSGSDGIGMHNKSLAWSINDQGYTQGLYNTSALDGANGLVVRITSNSASSHLLDLSVVASGSTLPVLVARGNGSVGIGINNPVSQLSNTAANIIGSDGYGMNGNSMAWSTSSVGYTMGIYNASSAVGANGLAIKIANTAASSSLLDLSAETSSGLLTVLVARGDGNVGIGTSNPREELDVSGNIIASGNFIMGLEYRVAETSMNGNIISERLCHCPNGKKVIGGGGGHRDFNLAQTDIRINFSGPLADGSAWRVLFNNTSSSDRAVQVWAICAKVR